MGYSPEPIIFLSFFLFHISFPPGSPRLDKKERRRISPSPLIDLFTPQVKASLPRIRRWGRPNLLGRPPRLCRGLHTVVGVAFGGVMGIFIAAGHSYFMTVSSYLKLHRSSRPFKGNCRDGTVLGHFMDGVVDGIQAVLLGTQAARSNLPWVAPNSQSTRHARFFLVEAVMLSSGVEPSISANLAACSSSLFVGGFSQYRPISG